jgi:hypothetical protein
LSHIKNNCLVLVYLTPPPFVEKRRRIIATALSGAIYF